MFTGDREPCRPESGQAHRRTSSARRRRSWVESDRRPSARRNPCRSRAIPTRRPAWADRAPSTILECERIACSLGRSIALAVVGCLAVDHVDLAVFLEGPPDEPFDGLPHRLDLVVGDVDDGGAEVLVQLLDLGAHVDAQLGVEVRQRLVEQEHIRIAHDRAAHRDALALAAGELARLAVEQLARSAGASATSATALVALGLGRPCASPGRRRCSAPRSCSGRARSSGTPSRCRASTGATSFTTASSMRDLAGR